jgi:hypothetical protein
MTATLNRAQFVNRQVLHGIKREVECTPRNGSRSLGPAGESVRLTMRRDVIRPSGLDGLSCIENRLQSWGMAHGKTG